MSLSIKATSVAFERQFPEATIVNIMDDSLSRDVAHSGLDAHMYERFSKLGNYAASLSVDAILFTCSAFGGPIERVQSEHNMPVLKPNEALQQQIIGHNGRVCIMSIFQPTLPSITQEIQQTATSLGKYDELNFFPQFVPEALEELNKGNADECANYIARAALSILTEDKNVSSIALAMFSMAFARDKLVNMINEAKADGKLDSSRKIEVITSPDAAVIDLKSKLFQVPT
eukprot:CAMPEP_0204836710 /NCGR_PEP_ID=MMETSP1346-20131115/25953_1 /ASSEMBLY_ACC=CAM_ASM_000771 /TAXON_ID=215587 /ORGANISM="Aplanochytrium stocchinoi, Strain GSBS06" /LENGTH=229 /DNA_ID=CAMNT_0051971649 /DNA_START=165 /DNA_END=854 /DNA_ORIENTATION=-